MWLRWDVETPNSDVASELAEALNIHVAQALGHYFACCSGFGAHRPDGNVHAVTDTTLEQWALWTGRKGRFAVAFRSRCMGENGIVRGWWRQDALLRKQAIDRAKPPFHRRGSPGGKSGVPPGESGGNPRGKIGGSPEIPPGDGTERNGTTSSDQRARATLADRLVGAAGRSAVTAFLDALPPGENAATWEPTLLGCLDGLGLAQGHAATVDELAAACNDYRKRAPARWGVVHFRSFVDRIVAKRFRPARPPNSSPSEAIAAGARWLGKEAPA
jgi:hypothetical protein